METIQQQIAALQISVKRQGLAIIALAGVIVAGGFIAAVRPVGDATFDTITCKGWQVVDKDEKLRIGATTDASRNASVGWIDKDGKVRILLTTRSDGDAGATLLGKKGEIRIKAITRADGDARLDWYDNNGKLRIAATTYLSGNAGVSWFDKDEKNRINAVTTPSGTVFLPTEDLNFSMKP